MAKNVFQQLPEASPVNCRLLPNVVDEIAATESDALYGEISALPTSYDAGFKPITWKAFANAVNGLAILLDSKLGMGLSSETLSYMGPSDPRYPLMILAGAKAGYKTLLSSPRNSIAAHGNLFERLEYKTIITTLPEPLFLAPILEGFPDMKVLHIPGMDELLATRYGHSTYNKTYEEVKHEPMFCLHTSGSTGLPKPIAYSHAFITTTLNISQY